MRVLEQEGFLYGSLEDKLVVLQTPEEIVSHLNGA
jgi:hypothetical protein